MRPILGLLVSALALCLVGLPFAAADEIDNRIAELNGQDANVRMNAAEGLAKIGPAAQKALPDLRNAAKSDDAVLVVLATWAIASITEEFEPYLPVFTQALRGNATKPFLAACWSLGSLGPKAKAAVPELLITLRHENANYRLAAQAALLSITLDLDAYLAPVMAGLRSNSATARSIAGEGIRYGIGATLLPPAFINDAVNDNNKAVREKAARNIETLVRTIVEFEKETGAAGVPVGDRPEGEAQPGAPPRPATGDGEGAGETDEGGVATSGEGTPMDPPSISHVMSAERYRFRLTLSPTLHVENDELILHINPVREVLQTGGLAGALEGRVTDEIAPPYRFTVVRLVSPKGHLYNMRPGRAPLQSDEALQGEWSLRIVVQLGNDRRESVFKSDLTLENLGKPDLVVDSIEVLEDRRAQTVIRNSGRSPATVGGEIPFSVHLEFGENIPGVGLVDWNYLDSTHYVKSLGPGETVTITSTEHGRVPSEAALIRASVDLANLIKESNEANNRAEIKVPGAAPGLRFVTWALWDIQPWGEQQAVIPTYRVQTDAVTAGQPFQLELKFEQTPQEEAVEVRLEGGMTPVMLTAKPTEDRLVYRTETVLLRPEDWAQTSAARKTEAEQVAAELADIRRDRLPASEVKVRELHRRVRDLETQAVDENGNDNSRYQELLAAASKAGEELAATAESLARLKAREEWLLRRQEVLSRGDFFLDKIVAERYFSEAAGSMQVRETRPMTPYAATDGATLRATASETSAEARAGIADRSLTAAISAQGTPCPDGKQTVQRQALDGVLPVCRGDQVRVEVTVHRTDRSGEPRPTRLELTIPNTSICVTRDAPAPGPDGTSTVTFDLDTWNPMWAMRGIRDRLPSRSWCDLYTPNTLPLAIEADASTAGGDAQYWNNTVALPLVLSGTTAENILCYIKAEAKKRAEGKQASVAGTSCFETLKAQFLADYFAAPSVAKGEAAVQEISRHQSLYESARVTVTNSGGINQGKRYFAKMNVPQSVRDRYPGMPEWIYPATRFFIDVPSNTIRVLDVSFLVGSDNLSAAEDADFIGGGRNSSNVMHWATGVGYSNLPQDAMRELFIGYELWHLEGWDVFGEDCLNDLISEEQGRIFGSVLRAGLVQNEEHLVKVMDDAFMESRAWVGALVGARRAELDLLVLAKEPPKADYWVGGRRSVAPWQGRSIRQMLADGETPDDVKQSALVQHLIQIYELVYWPDEWTRRTGGDIEVTKACHDMATGRYKSQFDAAPKGYRDVWDLDLSRPD